jgi:hypothetical protein
MMLFLNIEESYSRKRYSCLMQSDATKVDVVDTMVAEVLYKVVAPHISVLA